MKIVSLLPSATEIVCALGAGAELVGISHECDFPVSIRDRAVLTRSRIDAGGSSGEIDRAVRAVVRDALSIYAIDEEALGRTAPDVIVTQDLCEVCAVSLDDVRRAVARLAARDSVRIVSLHPVRLGDVLDDVERVAAAIARIEEGRALRAALERRMQEIAGRAAMVSRRPRVVTVEWIEPLMLGGTWMPELVELAGGVAVGVSPGCAAPTIAAAELGELAPEVILVKPCGFTLERTLGELEAIRNLAAHAPHARIYLTDGSAFFNRPGPRLVESLEILAACLHPELTDLAERHAAVLHRLDHSS